MILLIALNVLIWFMNNHELSHAQFTDLSKIEWAVKPHDDEYRIVIRVNIYVDEMVLVCPDCLSVSDHEVTCRTGDFVSVAIEMETDSKKNSVTINATCDEQQNTNAIEIVPVYAGLNDIHVLLKTGSNMTNFFVVLMTENSVISRNEYIKMQKLMLTNLKQRTPYLLCAAAIDFQWRTGPYACRRIATDSRVTGPPRNVRLVVDVYTIAMSWDVPLFEGDRPPSYVINVTENATGNCRSFIVLINGAKLTSNTFPCARHSIVRWTELQPLLIDGLTPFTSYDVVLQPVNGNRTPIAVKNTVSTKEGESEPVNELHLEIHDKNWLCVSFSPPANVRGKIIAYQVQVFLRRRHVCDAKNDTIHHTRTMNAHVYVPMHMLQKCEEYRVEVSVINGWGVGKPGVLIYKHKEAESFGQIRDIQSDFLSTNMLKVQWRKKQTSCDNTAAVIEVRDAANDSFCVVQVVSSYICDDMNQEVLKRLRCKKENLRISKLGTSEVNDFSALITADFGLMKQFYISLWTFDIEMRLASPPVKINSSFHDCFTDCHTENAYVGIRSMTAKGKKCIPWNEVPYKRKDKSKSSFCTKTPDKPLPWCVTRDNLMESCNIPNCFNMDIATGCVKSVQYITTTSSISINWDRPEYQKEFIGYIVLLQNVQNVCEQYHLQLCHLCDSEESFHVRIKSFYSTCLNGITQRQMDFRASFGGLYQYKRYSIYIIPILDKFSTGEVYRLTLTTDYEMPEVPKDIQLVSNGVRHLTFAWSVPSEYLKYGPADTFTGILINQETRQIVKMVTPTNSITFEYLNPCSYYCFSVNAKNKVDETKFSSETCSSTLSPDLGYVILNEIKSDYLPYQKVTWKYSKSDSCSRRFFVDYWDAEGNHFNKSTNTTETTLVNLKTNMLYSVKVQPRTLMKTPSNSGVGIFSKEKHFYTGFFEPKLMAYSDEIDVKGTTLKVSWSIETNLNNSIFEFFVVIQDSLQTCIKVLNLVCDSCWTVNNRNLLNINQLYEIDQILDCLSMEKRGFSSQNISFNHTIHTDMKLSNIYIKIYGLTLAGVHKLIEKHKVNFLQDDLETKPNLIFTKLLELEYFGHECVKIFNETYLYFKFNPNFLNVTINQKSLTTFELYPCSDNENLPVSLQVNIGFSSLHFPLNVSCSNKNEAGKIISFDGKLQGNKILIDWKLSQNAWINYVYFSDKKDKFQQQILSQTINSQIIPNLLDHTIYYSCLSLIDSNWITGNYKCISVKSWTDGSSAEDFVSTVYANNVMLEWKKPINNKQSPTGYIINIRDEDNLCRTTLYNLKEKEILQTQKKFICSVVDHVVGKSTIEFTDLQYATKYTLNVYSLEPDKMTTLFSKIVRTFDGESSPVNDLAVSVVGDRVKVSFAKPSIPNGNIQKYLVRILKQNFSDCGSGYQDVIGVFTTNTSVDVYGKIFTTCSKYAVQVYPVNNWSNNHGIGKGAHHYFNLSDTNKRTSNVVAKALARNVIELTWEKKKIPDVCQSPIFVFKIKSKHLDTRDEVYLPASLTCTNLRKKICRRLECSGLNEYQLSSNSEMYSVILSKLNIALDEPIIEVWAIDGEISLVKTFTILYSDNDCHYDCFYANYSGVRSSTVKGHKCLNKDMLRSKGLEVPSENVCFSSGFSYPWCYTKHSWDHCNVPHCSVLKSASVCVSNVNVVNNENSIRVTWEFLDKNVNHHDGYIVLLFRNGTCHEGRIRRCPTCDSNLLPSVTNFFSNCKKFSTTYQLSKLELFQLTDSFPNYVIHIMPLLDHLTVGPVKTVPVVVYNKAQNILDRNKEKRVFINSKTFFRDISSYYYVQHLLESRTYLVMLQNFENDVKINCTSCKILSDISFSCTKHDFISLDITDSSQYVIRFNLTCGQNHDEYFIEDLKSDISVNVVQWTFNPEIQINGYFVFYSDGQMSQLTFVPPETSNYILPSMETGNWFQICVSVIDKSWINGRYRCNIMSMNYAKTGPVRNLETYFQSNNIKLSWKRPFIERDNPQGYIITYVDKDNICNAVLLVTVSSFPIDKRNPASCRVETIIYSRSLIPVTIHNLKFNTFYNITVTPVNHDKIPVPVTKRIYLQF